MFNKNNTTNYKVSPPNLKFIPTPLATADDNFEWTKINHRCLTEMIAQVIKNCIKCLKRPQSIIGNQLLEDSDDQSPNKPGTRNIR